MKKKRTKPETRSDYEIGQAWMRAHCRMPSLAELIRLSNEQATLPPEPPKVQGELFTYRPAS